MASGDRDRQARRLSDVVDGIGSVAGGVAGAAVGQASDPATGAAVGAMLGRVLQSTGGMLVRRHLEERQEFRVGDALQVAGQRIQERLGAGATPREDWFDEVPGGRSDAKELLEGVLLRAAETYQERKIPYLGNLYAGLAFAPEIAPDYGHLLLTVASRLTYRQLVLMASVANGPEKADLAAGLQEERDAARFLFGDELALELNELGGFGIVGEEKGGQVRPPSQVFIGSRDFRAVEIGAAALTPHGQTLHRLMELNEIPLADRRKALGTTWAVPPSGQADGS